NQLLREGAGLVESVEDVLSHLGLDPGPESPRLAATPPPGPPAPPPDIGSQSRPSPDPPVRQCPVKENRASLGASGGRMSAENETAGAAEAARKIAESLGSAPVAVDELVRRCQMSPPVVRAALLDLELAGRLERHPGDRYSLLPA
ncbi:MAG: hypothetical protein HY055_16095, partial [Magnetospirillum sp.]|nr:hypothetical protein [Magnetospirillum sp.]